MFNCIWNGQRIDAFEISKQEKTETAIRNAGKQGQLRCIDPECTSTLGYKHGSKKEAHFFHHSKSICEYDAFEKNDKIVIKNVRNALFEHFKNIGYNIEREYRLSAGGKFCHLFIKFDEKKIVLQIADKSTSTSIQEEWLKRCLENKCELKWIVIGDPNEFQDEYKNYYIHRHLLNNSRNQDLIIIDETASFVSQTKVFEDPEFCKKESNYKIVEPLNHLIIEDGEITIMGFNKKFSQWFAKEKAVRERLKSEETECKKHYAKGIKDLSYYDYGLPNYNRLNPISYSKSLDIDEDSVNDEKTLQTEIGNGKFKIGVRVDHPKYGSGVISDVYQDNDIPKVHIKFDSGYEENFSVINLIRSNNVKIIEE